MIAPNDTRNWQVSMDDPAAIVEGVDDIVQSINIILTTIPGSDPLRPEFGSNVYQYLDKPLPSVLGLSLIHISSPRDRSLSRMPSSA